MADTAIEVARRMRQGTTDLSPSGLYALAGEDAKHLLDLARTQASGVGATATNAPDLVEVLQHLDEEALAAGIFRHAMIEAGALVDANTMKPHDPCPRCGHRHGD